MKTVLNSPQITAAGNESVPTGSRASLIGSSGEFFHRDLSWIEFNRRVLEEALDERTPLLERVNFMGIFSSNLDEFFMKRVGGYKRQVEAGLNNRNHEGLSAQEMLIAIRQHVLPLLQTQADCFVRELQPQLLQNGIELLRWAEITEEERTFSKNYFRKNVFPMLTPLAVDPGHPFPFLSNLSMSLGVTLCHPDSDDILFARVKVPKSLPQWIRLTDEAQTRARFLSLNELIHYNLEDLFPKMRIVNVMPFRITRNIDIERDESDAEDLLEMIEEELKQRRFAEIIRLEHGPSPDPWMLEFLIEELELSTDDVYEMPLPLDLSDLKLISSLDYPNLKFENWMPVVPPNLLDDESNIFQIIRKGDLLVHHPYESFSSSVERFIRTAAEDPKVMGIKMTLYRTGENSPFIASLIRAAELGKQVVCLVELKARFDEARNILWAQQLERAGVHVVYGIVGLKTHCKTALVMRNDHDGLRCYIHIGTGNYNAATSRVYTDFGLMSARPDLAEDVVELFHYLTGRSLKSNYKKLLVAPVTMQEQFVQLIEREIANKKQGKPAGIVAKMNSLEDPTLCRALYKASQAGVSVQLIVRGFCTLRPQLPELSENIEVISVIGRFLEHSRVYHFRNGQPEPADGEVFIGSADWMSRNLKYRVEAIVPIEDRNLKEKCWETLQIHLKDRRQTWSLGPDGQYVRRHPLDAEQENTGSHLTLMKLARQRATVGGIRVEEEIPVSSNSRKKKRKSTQR